MLYISNVSAHLAQGLKRGIHFFSVEDQHHLFSWHQKVSGPLLIQCFFHTKWCTNKFCHRFSNWLGSNFSMSCALQPRFWNVGFIFKIRIVIVMILIDCCL